MRVSPSWTCLDTLKWWSAAAATRGWWVTQKTCRVAANCFKRAAMAPLMRPLTPLSISSKSRVTWGSAAARQVLRASRKRLISPPEATSARGARGWPGLAENRKHTASLPSSLAGAACSCTAKRTWASPIGRNACISCSSRRRAAADREALRALWAWSRCWRAAISRCSRAARAAAAPPGANCWRNWSRRAIRAARSRPWRRSRALSWAMRSCRPARLSGSLSRAAP